MARASRSTSATDYATGCDPCAGRHQGSPADAGFVGLDQIVGHKISDLREEARADVASARELPRNHE